MIDDSNQPSYDSSILDDLNFHEETFSPFVSQVRERRPPNFLDSTLLKSLESADINSTK